MSAAPARVAPARPRVAQPSLFEADPYRVARKRKRPQRVNRGPARVATASGANAHGTLRAPTITAVGAPEHSASLVPFVALCVAIILASMVSVLLLNISMTSGAYETRDLRSELARLEDQTGEMRAQIESASSPQSLAAAAAALGMVRASHVGFVTIETGNVVPPGAAG